MSAQEGLNLPAARSSWLLASEMRDLSPLDSWARLGKQACFGAFCIFCHCFSLPPHLWPPLLPISPLLSPHLADGSALPRSPHLRATERGGQTACSFLAILQRVVGWGNLARNVDNLRTTSHPGLISFCLRQGWRWFRKLITFPLPSSLCS